MGTMSTLLCVWRMSIEGGLKEFISSLCVGRGGVSDFSVVGKGRGGNSFKTGIWDWREMG